MFFLSCVCHAFVRVCLNVPCGHLLGKGLPLGSRLWCLTVSLSFSYWHPGSGVVLIGSIPDIYTLTYCDVYMGKTLCPHSLVLGSNQEMSNRTEQLLTGT